MRSPFVAAAMSEALCSTAELGVIGANAGLCELTRYLRDTREVDGSWCFEPHGRRWPPDADSTACALAVMARAGETAGEPVLRQILQVQPAADGLIRPWLLWYSAAQERLDGNVADAIVTANVLFAANRIEEDRTELLRRLEAHLLTQGLGRLATVYYDSLAVRSYYLARALTPVSLSQPIATAVVEFLTEFDGDGVNIVDLAAALAAAALLGVTSTARRLLPRVLSHQQTDGTWPAARWFVDPADKVWSSAAFSTALAVEALALIEGGAGSELTTAPVRPARRWRRGSEWPGS